MTNSNESDQASSDSSGDDELRIKSHLEETKHFYIGNLQFTFDISEPIFFRKEPAAEMKAIESCRSCKYKFKDKKEMVKCTFCSFGGCKDCTKKTRYFPDSR